MKLVLQDGQHYLLRFDKDEDVIAGLAQFCEEHRVKAGSFSGIGSASQLTLSWYDPKDTVYNDHDIEDALEIISLLGNVSILEGHVAIHAHGSFSDYQLKVRAGHVKKLMVAATCEISLQVLAGTATRAHNPDWNLKLLS